MVRRASNVDANQKEVVKAFRDAGCSVKHVHQIKGFVDVVVGFRGETHLVEIKDGDKPPSAQKLTEDEQEFWDTWTGSKPIIVRSASEVPGLVLSWSRRCNAPGYSM